MRGKGLPGVGKGTAGRDAGFVHERQPEKNNAPQEFSPELALVETLQMGEDTASVE